MILIIYLVLWLQWIIVIPIVEYACGFCAEEILMTTLVPLRRNWPTFEVWILEHRWWYCTFHRTLKSIGGLNACFSAAWSLFTVDHQMPLLFFKMSNVGSIMIYIFSNSLSVPFGGWIPGSGVLEGFWKLPLSSKIGENSLIRSISFCHPLINLRPSCCNAHTGYIFFLGL